jgi:hypothetical protein
VAFSWSDFLSVGDWLIEAASTHESIVPSEAMYRSATSRAYYSALQSAMALLVKKGEFQPTGAAADHGEVLRTYQYSASQVRKRIAIDLGRLRPSSKSGL